MIRILIYLLLVGAILYLLVEWGRQKQAPPPAAGGAPTKPRSWFRPRKNPREVWVQVYETASLDEARNLQARLQEEEIECVLYEQGKRDIHGNLLKGIGIAVPKTAAPHAQAVISRMPV